MQIQVNDQQYEIPKAWQSATLNSVLRDFLNLTGTKFGCGKGLCGACTVHVDGQAVRSCILPVSALGSSPVTTIEGLAQTNQLHPVQQAWLEESVPQCGYCQVGQIMTASAFIDNNPDPTEQGIIEAMNGNLCRCGAYSRIRRGVKRAAIIAKEAAR